MRGNCAALREVNLELAAGEHVCILGPNGCGKSTLIKTITRECYPLARDRCSISILGHERWNIFELRSLLGIVSPDLLVSCTTEATGKDVVLSGFFSSTRILPHHHPEPELLGRAEAALDRLGIAHLADRPVAQMSSGEAKRTLIARALVHNPQTLLVDEPSTGMDMLTCSEKDRTSVPLGKGAGHPSEIGGDRRSLVGSRKLKRNSTGQCRV